MIAGGPGAGGAAILCGHAALRAGAGLVTVIVPVPVYRADRRRRAGRVDGPAVHLGR